MSVCPDCGFPWMPPHPDRACGAGPKREEVVSGNHIMALEREKSDAHYRALVSRAE